MVKINIIITKSQIFIVVLPAKYNNKYISVMAQIFRDQLYSWIAEYTIFVHNKIYVLHEYFVKFSAYAKTYFAEKCIQIQCNA